MIYNFIDINREKYPVRKMCKYLGIGKNAYYSWRRLKNTPKKVSRKDELIKKVKHIYRASTQTYGSPRIAKELKKQGISISCCYVGRLMKSIGIKSVLSRKFVATTDSAHSYKVEENKLNRNFQVNELGKVWVSDITYIKVGNTWAYLTVIIDLADRKVVGWSLGKDMTFESTVLKAWGIERSRRQLSKGFILHSDRGIQYACNGMKRIFQSNNYISQSMSRKGNCWDNAVAESFFKTIKYEMVYRYKFNSFEQLYDALFEYIENWYNIKRLHSSLGYITPLQREIELMKIYKLAA